MTRTSFGRLVPRAFVVAVMIPVSLASQAPPAQPDTVIDAATRTEVIHSLAASLRANYVFPDVAEKLARMLEAHDAKGEYAAVTSARAFGDLLTRQLADIAHDGHLRVYYFVQVLPAPPAQRAVPPQADPRMERQLQRDNFAFDRLEILGGNVGYLKFHAFADAGRGGETVAAAMAFLANTDAMVIDLRDNHGGSPAMVDLIASYFFGGGAPVHLNDLSMRKPGTPEHDLVQWWTLPSVPGKRYVDKEVYILTSHGTFSGAEEFTYDLKAQKRATVVGETTGGGANPGGPQRLGDHFAAFVPRGQPINPVTGTNWEGTGIEPDIKTTKEGAFKAAHVAALQHLIEKARDDAEANYLKRALAAADAAGGAQP